MARTGQPGGHPGNSRDSGAGEWCGVSLTPTACRARFSVCARVHTRVLDTHTLRGGRKEPSLLHCVIQREDFGRSSWLLLLASAFRRKCTGSVGLSQGDDILWGSLGLGLCLCGPRTSAVKSRDRRREAFVVCLIQW